MDWYYAANGQQAGPVTEAQLGELHRAGTINGSTLIWREGMPEWQPLQSANPAILKSPPPVSGAPGPSNTAPFMVGGSAPCAECQRVFPQTEMVFLNRCWVCAQCKPIFIQRMKEGIGPVGSQLWRFKRQLICSPDTLLPDRCVKCNAPAGGSRLKRQLYWHPPLVYLLILVNLLVYAIVAVLIRKRAKLEIGLCQTHRKRRVLTISICWMTALMGIALVVYGGMNSSGGAAFLGVVAALTAMIVGAVLGPQVSAARIDKDHVWVKGVCSEYLETLPEWTGPK